MHRLFMTLVLQVWLVLFAPIAGPASAQGTTFEQAASNFSRLPRDSRYEVQMLLIAGGYSDAVSTDVFSTRIYDAIARFQTTSGYAPNGSLTLDQLGRLRDEASPVLQSWGLSAVRIPGTNMPVWIPKGLGLTAKAEKGSLTFSNSDNTLLIALIGFSEVDLKTAFREMVSFLRSKGHAVSYNLLKSDFFVISTAEPDLESYMRFQVTPGGVVGFWTTWRPGGPYYGKRLATIMSDLFRSSAYGDFRSPPVIPPAPITTRQPPEAAAQNPDQSPRTESHDSSGSGFFVSSSGNILTNAHVVEGCRTITVSRLGAPGMSARVIAKDSINDLALLQAGQATDSVAVFRPNVRVGEAIAAYGFPLSGILATSGNFTMGNVTATAGLQDDSRMLQISSPVQPGNSGGPLLDQSGNVVGVVVAKLDALKFAAITQDVPQNINFAIKASVAQTFLDTNGINNSTTTSSNHIAPEDLADKAKSIAVFIQCGTD